MGLDGVSSHVHGSHDERSTRRGRIVSRLGPGREAVDGWDRDGDEGEVVREMVVRG